MHHENSSNSFPSYDAFVDKIKALNLPISSSELHGIMCGYLCLGASQQGEMHLSALIIEEKKTKAIQEAKRALFAIYDMSKQQLLHLDFEFKLLLPDDSFSLKERAEAFSQWCQGFIQSMTLNELAFHHLEDSDCEEALQHLSEFAELDYQSLTVSEDDEKALMEVSEYTRMAVLNLSASLKTLKANPSVDTAH